MGEHKRNPLAEAVKAAERQGTRAIDLSALATSARDPNEWFPPPFGANCANCYWCWTERQPGTNKPMPSCHLLPRQCVIVNGNTLAAARPGIIEPEQEMCSAWKARLPPPEGDDNGGK